MNTLKDVLGKVILSQPDVLQFAKDRKFEEAWIINRKQKEPSKNEIDSYLSKEKFETLIVEYVWESHNDDKRFVITIFLDKKCQLQDPKQFIEISLSNFYHYSGFENLIDDFNSKVVGNSYLLEKTVESVNLSVFNHWLSVGPVDLWNQNEIYKKETVLNKIKSRPEIEKTKLNFQGLFFRFNVGGKLNGPYYGIKTPCCNKVGDEWVIDYDKVDYWMKLMLRIN